MYYLSEAAVVKRVVSSTCLQTLLKHIQTGGNQVLTLRAEKWLIDLKDCV